MKVFLVGVWVVLVALGSSYAAAMWKAGAAKPVTETRAEPAPTQFLKTRAISVPMIADGTVQGYVVVQFGLTLDGALMKKVPVPPEVFVVDEAFRLLYTDDQIDFKHLKKYDIPKFTKTVQDNTNARLKEAVVKQILVQEMSYVEKQGDLR